MNPYLEYYNNQAQTGAGYYSGTRYNLRGRGIFSSLFAKALPAIKWLGRHALKTGINIAGDALEGKNVLQSTKSRLKDSGHEMVNEGIDRAKSFLQTGKGMKKALGPNLIRKRMSVTTKKRKSVTINKSKSSRSKPRKKKVKFDSQQLF